VEILQGKTDRRKVFQFAGINPDDLQAAVATILAETDS
jgi:uncharacterized protein YggU (UPF0235/DUF167 family)